MNFEEPILMLFTIYLHIRVTLIYILTMVLLNTIFKYNFR